MAIVRMLLTNFEMFMFSTSFAFLMQTRIVFGIQNEEGRGGVIRMRVITILHSSILRRSQAILTKWNIWNGKKRKQNEINIFSAVISQFNFDFPCAVCVCEAVCGFHC